MTVYAVHKNNDAINVMAVKIKVKMKVGTVDASHTVVP